MNDHERTYCDNVVILGNHPAKYNTFELVERIIAEGIPGDYAEAGVAGGGHSAIISTVLRKHGVGGKVIHLFDSFQGIPQAGPRDTETDKRVYGLNDGTKPIISSGISAATVEQVHNNLTAWGSPIADFRFHKGWFQETMEHDAKEVGPLAYIRIDVDLYESVYTCFRCLYPKVVKGGFIVFDDYGYGPDSGGNPCRLAMFEAIDAIGEKRPEVTEVIGNPGTVWWRKP